MKNLLIFLLIACNGAGELEKATKNTSPSEDQEKSSEVVLTDYIKTKYENECEGKEDGEIFSSTFYKNAEPSFGECEPELRKAFCKNGKLKVTGTFRNIRCTSNIEQAEASECKKGKVLTVGIDTDDDGEIDQHVGDILAYKGDLTAKENYNYYSASAHPKNNIDPKGFAHHIYFYQGEDGLSMQFYYNVDAGGSKNNIVEVDIDTFYNDLDDHVILSDDRGEIKLVSESKIGKKYEGRYHYWSNTDGGIIGPFEGDDFKIIVKPKQHGDNTESKFYSADGKIHNLMTDNKHYTYIIKFKENNTCGEEVNLGCYTQEYVKNGGFERFDFITQEQIEAGMRAQGGLSKISPWLSNADLGAGISIQVADGKYDGIAAHSGYAKVKLDFKAKEGFLYEPIDFYQIAILNPGETYDFRFFHSPGLFSGENKFKIKLSERDPQSGDWIVSLEKEYDNSERGWHEKVIRFRANSSEYKLALSGGDRSNSLRAYFDTISIKNVKLFGNEHDESLCLKRHGVSTALLSLGSRDNQGEYRIGYKEVKSILNRLVAFSTPRKKVRSSRILIVRDSNHHGEDYESTQRILEILQSRFHQISLIDEPESGLSEMDVLGFDLVIMNNPGWPFGKLSTLQTLKNAAEFMGVVLIGDDMSFSNNHQFDSELEELTGLKHLGNGTKVCGVKTDNYNGKEFNVELNFGQYKNQPLFYGNDIDQVEINKNKMVTFGKINGVEGVCELNDRPVIVGYKKAKN